MDLRIPEGYRGRDTKSACEEGNACSSELTEPYLNTDNNTYHDDTFFTPVLLAQGKRNHDFNCGSIIIVVVMMFCISHAIM